MLKKVLTISLVIFVFLSLVGPLLAANKERVTAKINRGGKKIITSPLEIPKGVVQTTKESNVLFGVLFGPIRGVCNFFSQLTSGSADVAGCNVGETQEEYLKPQMVPEAKK